MTMMMLWRRRILRNKYVLFCPWIGSTGLLLVLLSSLALSLSFSPSSVVFTNSFLFVAPPTVPSSLSFSLSTGARKKSRQSVVVVSLSQNNGSKTEEEEEDDGWGVGVGVGDTTATSSSTSSSVEGRTSKESNTLTELRALQQERILSSSSPSSSTISSGNTVVSKSSSLSSAAAGGDDDDNEQERDLFIPLFALVSLAGLMGAYGYETLRLAARGELYLPNPLNL